MNNNITNRINSFFKSLISNKKNLIKVLLVLVILLSALILKLYENNNDDIEVESAQSDSMIGVICVDLGGEVVSPGIYQVETDTRLYEVIELAGGLTSNADTESINQAAYVEDGEKIIIPIKTAQITSDGSEGEIDGAENLSSSASNSGLININYATKDELKTLSGIGDVIADRIIEYRTGNKFKNKEDIKSVKGIGDAIFEKIEPYITV